MHLFIVKVDTISAFFLHMITQTKLIKVVQIQKDEEKFYFTNQI